MGCDGFNTSHLFGIRHQTSGIGAYYPSGLRFFLASSFWRMPFTRP